MTTINKVVLVGNVVGNVKKRTGNDDSIRFQISTKKQHISRTMRERSTIEPVDIHNIRLKSYKKINKSIDCLVVGAKVYVEGQISYGKYLDKEDGVEKNVTNIFANFVGIL